MDLKDENVVTKENVDSEREPQLPLGWGKYILFFLTFFGFTIVLGIIVGIIFAIIDYANGSNLLEEGITYYLLLEGIAIVLAILIFKSVRNFLKGAFSFKPLKQGKTYLFLLAAFVINFVAQFLIMNVFQLEDGTGQVDTFALGDISFHWLNIFFLYLGFTIVTPIKEEILYRGLLHGFLARRYHFLIGLVVSSVIFGLLHTGHVFSATISGVIMVLLYRFSQSLIIPILFHILWNMYAVTGLLLYVNNL
ncbi:CPBP family intramembrane glutamic endopeptidase [Evansella cellulosilytica]|uniref:Abortive infection protein n=1 Tax=Evansella cellulosilytica (strain ATCC 21833 / DSM 2522 / FERM P-1141 / JCM 9156 / N-4) TaxID=649639 RepID=E6TZB7_EVAC2|nr:type II CAAX endopeptidase family protein [Evansella cellulosilytica]ADU28979.1 Abortive infection protein [Evansella cellulosilytica DSM 2522]